MTLARGSAMDDRLHTILARTGRGDLDTVAAGGLGGKATVIGEPVLTAVPSQITDLGMPPLKWSTNWDMIVPFLGGLNDGWKTRKAGRYRA